MTQFSSILKAPAGVAAGIKKPRSVLSGHWWQIHAQCVVIYRMQTDNPPVPCGHRPGPLRASCAGIMGSFSMLFLMVFVGFPLKNSALAYFFPL